MIGLALITLGVGIALISLMRLWGADKYERKRITPWGAYMGVIIMAAGVLLS